MNRPANAPTEGIRTTVEAPQPWQRIIKAEVDRSVYDKAYAQKLKKAVKSHQKPGFRKGRTPQALVEKEVGDILRYETIEALVPKAWMAALMEHRLAAITDPELDNLKFDDGQPLTFDLVVEVKPEIQVGSFENLPLRRRALEVKEDEVDGVLERLRESRVTYEAVQRAARDTDQITLDLTPQEEGPEGPARTIEGQRFVLGKETNLEAFNEQLQGCEAGQETRVKVDYPADFPNEQLQGRTVEFLCRITGIAERTLPELDDAFAGALEEGKTLDQLRADIRRDLEQEATARIAQELDQQIRRELIARNEVSLPPSMVQRYLESGLEELHARNQRLGRPSTEEEDRQYLEAGRPHAEEALKALLLLEAIRRQEDIKVTAEDVDERIGEIAAQNGFDVDRYREFVNSGEEKGRIEYDLLERRTYDLVLSRAQVEEVPADTEVV